MGLAKTEAEIAERAARFLKAELKRADLTYEELARLVRIACGLGITKVRLTGGGPLVNVAGSTSPGRAEGYNRDSVAAGAIHETSCGHGPARRRP